jgi:hypothetical protein
MQLMRLAMVVIATLAVAGSYFQEWRRLALIKRLPGPQARAYYEATRQRDERLLGAVTVVLAAAAIAAGVYALATRVS